MSEKIINIPFTLLPISSGIDYYRINDKTLTCDGFIVEKSDIDLSDGKYFDEYIKDIDSHKSETIVINVQVGKGKTTACYQLIKNYVDSGDYYVIMCSPFKKLVEKDAEELKKMVSPESVTTYTEIKPYDPDKLNESDKIDAQNMAYKRHNSNLIKKSVQVMTINCLLQNSGSDSFEQAVEKSEYLKQLREHIAGSGKKLLIFFDELHESVNNFNFYRLPNLMKWRTITHKCIVSTATFTPASFLVLKYISQLTASNITIFEAKRVKSVVQANIHLHITDNIPNSKSTTNTIYPIRKIIDNNNDKQLNIVTSSKALAVELHEFFKDNFGEITFTLLTGDHPDNKYTEDKNHIGTTFKTGVNITTPDSVLILILPDLTKQSTYGVFTDGIISIIQSVARMRNGGDIHLFIKTPSLGFKKCINIGNPQKSHGHLWPTQLLSLENKAELQEYNYLNDADSIIEEIYKRKKNSITEEIDFLSNNQQKSAIPYSYPSLEEFLINASSEILAQSKAAYGQKLSPITLYYCLHDQFCNATLKTISLYTKYTKCIELQTSSLTEDIKKLIPEQVEAEIQTMNFQEAIRFAIDSFQTSTEEGITYTINFKLGGKAIKFSTLKNNCQFVLAVVQNIFSIKAGAGVEISKENYIHSCIHYAKVSAATSQLKDSYVALGNVLDDFLKFINSHAVAHSTKGNIIPNDILQHLPATVVDKMNSIIPTLRQEDHLIKTKTISFLQKYDVNKNHNEQQKSIYNALVELTLITGDRVTHTGKPHYSFTLKDRTIGIWDSRCSPI